MLKSDRERQPPYDLTCVWNLKTKQMKKQNRNRLIDQTYSCQILGGDSWGLGGKGTRIKKYNGAVTKQL